MSDIVSSNEACALAAICLPMSCTPAAQIWPDFTIASRLPWLNATSSSAVFIAFSMPSFTFSCVSANPAAACVMPSFSPDTVDFKALVDLRRLVFDVPIASIIFGLLAMRLISWWTAVRARLPHLRVGCRTVLLQCSTNRI